VLSVPAFFCSAEKASQKKSSTSITHAKDVYDFSLLQGFQNLVGVLFLIINFLVYTYKVLKTLQETYRDLTDFKNLLEKPNSL